MGKRERETPCGICGHYHRFEEGEVCGICGHRIGLSSSTTNASLLPVNASASAFPSEILSDFLFLGSFDNASRTQLLKAQGISRILNTVPGCQTLCNNSIIYHNLQEGKSLAFEDANLFLEQCERDKARVLVHCMSGKNRSPAIVVGFLMKSRGWRLAQSYQWVKDRRPMVDLTEAVLQQLQEYEKQIFGHAENADSAPSFPSLNFGFGKCESNQPHALAFSSFGADSSILSRTPLPNEFVFGAAQPSCLSNSDIAMDSS